jgi:hypothetical protein
MNNLLQSPPKGQPQCDVLTSANTVAFLSDTSRVAALMNTWARV